MSDRLDQRIRTGIAELKTIGGVTPIAADAFIALLDMPNPVGSYDHEGKWAAAGYQQALLDMRHIIAAMLGLTQENTP